MIKKESKRRRQKEAGRMTVTVCGAQVDSLKKTVRFIRPYIQCPQKPFKCFGPFDCSACIS